MRKFLCVLLCLILILLVVGCTQQKKEESATAVSTITDATGYSLTLTKKPEKIISLTLVSDELLLSLADGSQIKALSHWADDPGVSNIVDKARQIPGRVQSDPEVVIAQQADLVIMADWQPPELARILRDAHVPVYVYKSPQNLDELRQTILAIAQLVGNESAGKNLTAWVDQELKKVEQKVGKNTQKLTILQYNSFGSTSGSQTMFDSIVEHAGLINVASQAGLKQYPNLPKEKIVELNPDIIFIPSWSATGITSEQMIAELMNDKSLATVKAVKNHNIICIDDRHMSSLSQYVVYGVGDMAKAAYPELFKE